MKIEKIKEKTIKELIADYELKKAKLYAYELDIKGGKEKDTSKVKKMKRDIAKILTIINIKKAIDEVIKNESIVKEDNK